MSRLTILKTIGLVLLFGDCSQVQSEVFWSKEFIRVSQQEADLQDAILDATDSNYPVIGYSFSSGLLLMGALYARVLPRDYATRRRPKLVSRTLFALSLPLLGVAGQRFADSRDAYTKSETLYSHSLESLKMNKAVMATVIGSLLPSFLPEHLAINRFSSLPDLMKTQNKAFRFNFALINESTPVGDEGEYFDIVFTREALEEFKASPFIQVLLGSRETRHQLSEAFSRFVRHHQNSSEASPLAVIQKECEARLGSFLESAYSVVQSDGLGPLKVVSVKVTQYTSAEDFQNGKESASAWLEKNYAQALQNCTAGVASVLTQSR